MKFLNDVFLSQFINDAYYAKVTESYQMPEGYRQLLYIETNGTQAINLGVTPNQNTGFEIEFMSYTAPATTNSPHLINAGGRSNVVPRLAVSLYKSSKDRLNGEIVINTTSVNADIIDHARSVLRYINDGSAETITYSNGNTVNITTGDFNANGQLILFALINNNVYDRYFIGRLYGLKLYNLSTLEYHFVPAMRESDSVIGLYDLVNDNFITNQGQESFGYSELKILNRISQLIIDKSVVTDNNFTTAYKNQIDDNTAAIEVIQQEILDLTALNLEVVEQLPVSDISTNTIYLMLKSPAGTTGDVYNEYIYVNNNWELIGNTQVDLTNYVQKEAGKGLSTNDFTDAYKNKLDGIEAGAEVNVIKSITLDGTAITPDSNGNVEISGINPVTCSKFLVGLAGGQTTSGITQSSIFRAVSSDEITGGVPYYVLSSGEYVTADPQPYPVDTIADLEEQLDTWQGTDEEYYEEYGVTKASDEARLQNMIDYNESTTFYVRSYTRCVIPAVMHKKGTDIIIKIYAIGDSTTNFTEKKLQDNIETQIAIANSVNYSEGDIIVDLANYDYQVEVWGSVQLRNSSEYPYLVFTKTSAGQCNVAAASGFDKTIVSLPDTVILNGEVLSVTSIANLGFNNRTSLISITIPNSVTTIGSSAFYNTNLTSINIPNSVTTIGYNAFMNCRNAETLTVPSSVTSIGNNALNGLTGLNSVNISSNADFTDAKLKIKSRNLSFYVLNKTQVEVAREYSAYQSLTGHIDLATPVIFGNTFDIVSLEDDLFYGVQGITSFTLSDYITFIPNQAFDTCRGLTSIVIPNTVTSIDLYAFSDCTSVTTVVIPSSVTTIGENAFLRLNSNCVIYCEAASKPAGWHNNWTDCQNIVWDYTPQFTITYCYGPTNYETDGWYTGDQLEHIDTYNVGGSVTEFDNEGEPNWCLYEWSRGTSDPEDVEWSSWSYSQDWSTTRLFGNFLRWVDSSGQTVNIPSVMPSHDITVYAVYDIEEDYPMA